MVIEKKETDEDKSSFKVMDLSAGNEEAGTIFNRIFISAQVLETPVGIEKGHDFNKELQEAKQEIESHIENTREDLGSTGMGRGFALR